MAYESIFEGVYGLLRNDATLVPSILGPVTPVNTRIYRAFPQWQSLFATYEPNQPSEGWLVIEEPKPFPVAANQQYRSNHEMLEIHFHIYGTLYRVTHDTLDILDQYFTWEVEQEVQIQWGERWLLFTRRFENEDKYAQETKLYEKNLKYRLEFVRENALYPRTAGV